MVFRYSDAVEKQDVLNKVTSCFVFARGPPRVLTLSVYR